MQTSMNNRPLQVNNQVNILQCERGLGSIAQWLAYLAPYPAALDSTPGVSENFPYQQGCLDENGQYLVA